MHPQRSFADVEYDGQPRQTRRERFLQRMEALMPWARLEARIRPVYPTGERGRPPYPLALRLRIHCVQLFYNLSDPAMEDALYDSVAVQRFVGLTARDPRPDETTILNFRHLLERHQLGEGGAGRDHPASGGTGPAAAGRHDRGRDHPRRAGVDEETAPRRRDPEMHQVKKGNQWYFGMKAHIGVDAATGLVHSLATTAANVADITQVPRLLHGAETTRVGATPAMRAWPGAPSTRGGGSTGRWPCARGSGGAWRPAAPPPRRSNARPRFERRWSIHFSM